MQGQRGRLLEGPRSLFVRQWGLVQQPVWWIQVSHGSLRLLVCDASDYYWMNLLDSWFVMQAIAIG